MDTESFQAYPEYSSNLFNESIYTKQEFNNNQLFLDLESDLCSETFSIKPHQTFSKNYMNKESHIGGY